MKLHKLYGVWQVDSTRPYSMERKSLIRMGRKRYTDKIGNLLVR